MVLYAFNLIDCSLFSYKTLKYKKVNDLWTIFTHCKIHISLFYNALLQCWFCTLTVSLTVKFTGNLFACVFHR